MEIPDFVTAAIQFSREVEKRYAAKAFPAAETFKVEMERKGAAFSRQVQQALTTGPSLSEIQRREFFDKSAAQFANLMVSTATSYYQQRGGRAQEAQLYKVEWGILAEAFAEEMIARLRR